MKSIPGVLDVRAKLTDKNVGQAEIFYNAAEVSPDDFKQAVPRASGEKHNFKVISVIEGG